MTRWMHWLISGATRTGADRVNKLHCELHTSHDSKYDLRLRLDGCIDTLADDLIQGEQDLNGYTSCIPRKQMLHDRDDQPSHDT